MCHFISAVLPGSADLSALEGVMARHGRALKSQSNPFLEAQLLPGERLLLTTAGHCDCGTALGALERNAALLERRRRSDERKEATLRRRGWSAARIQRWRHQRQNPGFGLHAQAAVTDWERLLAALLSQPRTPYVGLLLHWYGGGLDEPVALQGREALPLCTESLRWLREDVLAIFRAGGESGGQDSLAPPLA
ncbi:MAG: hypothetical protein ACKO25_13960 [Cyanobium sp.]